ncbi:MAG: dTDP-4-dehydrorhamnose reductase [Bacteroidetes bacterium]|nr:MAG: dTDP-4-dehydrorhamnose reductase [Bacteroidota bacterium]
MKNILITGSNGQLGSEIKDRAEQYPQLNFFFTDIEELDLTNRNAVEHFFKLNKIDACINCAAYTAVDKAEDERELSLLVNSEAVKILSQVSSVHGAFLIHISTDYVFDGRNFKPYTETDPPSPDSYYGLTKLRGEEAVFAFCNKAVIVRTSWLYSTYGNNFVKTMIRLGKEKEQLGVVVDQIGTPTYAGDLASALLEIIVKHDNSNINEIYHFSNEGAISWYDFAKTIMQEANLNCKVNPIESKDFLAKANRPFYSVLNKAKIKSDFAIEIPYWLDSLKIVINKLI